MIRPRRENNQPRFNTIALFGSEPVPIQKTTTLLILQMESLSRGNNYRATGRLGAGSSIAAASITSGNGRALGTSD